VSRTGLGSKLAPGKLVNKIKGTIDWGISKCTSSECSSGGFFWVQTAGQWRSLWQSELSSWHRYGAAFGCVDGTVSRVFFFFFFGDFIAKKRYDFLFSARTKVVEVCNGRSRHGMRLAGRVDPRAHWVDSWRALSGSPTPLLSDFMECA
jgi:hypothetical protein